MLAAALVFGTAFVQGPDARVLGRLPCATPPRSASSTCLLEDDSLSMNALRQELRRRSNEDGASKLEFAPGLGRFEKLQQLGPHHTTTPREVVEYVVNKLRQGEIHEAFTFTCIPTAKRGCHKSSTDWTRRMAWERARVIGGAPSGKAYDRDAFTAMVRKTYAPLLQTEGYRFLGDDSAWQQENGEKATSVKEYVVELKTAKGEHLLVKFQLVYDWLLYCHLIASVGILSAMSSKAFPGSEDIDLDI